MSAVYPRAVSRFGLAAMQSRAAPVKPAPAGGEVYPLRTGMTAPPRRRTVVRLWLPLTPLFVLLAPFALLLALLGYLVPPRWRPDPFFAAFAIGALLLALGGTDILIDTADAHVRIKIL